MKKREERPDPVPHLNPLEELDASAKRNKVKFIQEWTPTQFDQMQETIVKHFKKNSNWKVTDGSGSYVRRLPKTFEELNNVLGLAYTSSSSCAMYSICNVGIAYQDKPFYRYLFFAIGEDGECYVECWDKDENELIIKL